MSVVVKREMVQLVIYITQRFVLATGEYQAAVYKETEPGHFITIDDNNTGTVKYKSVTNICSNKVCICRILIFMPCSKCTM